MQYGVRIPPTLHSTIPTGQSVSGLIRQLLIDVIEHPETVAAALVNVYTITPSLEPAKRYAVYVPDEEYSKACIFAERYRLSLNQLIQILLEDLMFRAGRWPIGIDKSAN